MEKVADDGAAFRKRDICTRPRTDAPRELLGTRRLTIPFSGGGGRGYTGSQLHSAGSDKS